MPHQPSPAPATLETAAPPDELTVRAELSERLNMLWQQREGLSLRRLASALGECGLEGVSKSTLGDMRTATHSVRLPQVIAVARGFGVHPRYFLVPGPVDPREFAVTERNEPTPAPFPDLVAASLARVHPGQDTPLSRGQVVQRLRDARIYGLSPATLSRWRTGQSEPLVWHVLLLAWALEIRPDYFVAPEGTDPHAFALTLRPYQHIDAADVLLPQLMTVKADDLREPEALKALANLWNLVQHHRERAAPPAGDG